MSIASAICESHATTAEHKVMMPVLFQPEPEGFWQAAPRERPLWALVVALVSLFGVMAAIVGLIAT